MEFRPRRRGHVGPVPIEVVAKALTPSNPGHPFRFAIASLTWSATKDSRLRPAGCTWSEGRPELQLAGKSRPDDTFLLLEADRRRVHELWEWDGELSPVRLEPEGTTADRYVAHVCSTADRALLVASHRSAAWRVLLRMRAGQWTVEKIEDEWVE